MTLTLELFGIPRQRAGFAQCRLEFPGQQAALHEVLSEVAALYPALAGECIRGGRLTPGYTANLGGDLFLSDPGYMLSDGDELLILSADAGG